MIRTGILCALLLAFTQSAHSQNYSVPDLAAAFGRSVIVIEADQYACHMLNVFVAETSEQKRRGLMFVRNLPPMMGMLFVYGESDYHSMWMKNTYIPLDILFIRADGRVSSIARHTETLSLKSIAATEPVDFVLELNAGETERLYIEPESLLIF